VREALAIHQAVELHAMIDVSDGLAADVNHICEESRCGAVLVAEAVPVSDAARELSRTSGKTPLQHALGDGEDFELVFAVSPRTGRSCSRPAGPGLAKIGECVESGCGSKRTERENRSRRWGGCMILANRDREGAGVSSARSLTVTVRRKSLRQHGDGAGFAEEDQVAGAVVLEHLDTELLALSKSFSPPLRAASFIALFHGTPDALGTNLPPNGAVATYPASVM